MDELFAPSTPHIPDIELGFNDAKLTGVTPTYIPGGLYGEGFTTKDALGNDVNRFRWVFTLVDADGATLYDEGDPITVDCITGLQFFAKAKNLSKQVRIMKALLTPEEFAGWQDGRGVPGLADLVGRPVQVEVGMNDRGYPTVASVIAPRKRRASAGVAG